MSNSTQRDYFAELYVAGILGDSGWNVYFPKRDVGFDFIISRQVEGSMLLRPVQVKGLYPTATKTNKTVYGYRGRLTALHPEMVLAMPFFSSSERGAAPELIAYLPLSHIKVVKKGGYRCQPASYKDGIAIARRDSQKYFGEKGIKLLSSVDWGKI